MRRRLIIALSALCLALPACGQNSPGGPTGPAEPGAPQQPPGDQPVGPPGYPADDPAA
ncbi:MAG TPA: hypothetical protein VM638_04315 [Actinomycetota bacterium]|nr:hypothetical protein [Actinomycetota bacterium]